MNYQRAAIRLCQMMASQPCLQVSRFSSSATLSRPVASVPMPYITEVTERIICLNGPVDDTVSAAIVAQLLWLESDAPEKPITMYINSPGGERIRGQVNEIVRSHLNKAFGHEKYDLQSINDMMERDNYLTAEESKEHGIVDEILVKRP
ncbi:ATP-dependent clp protease proteolytic subunit [Grosmannia clavigera kw1407]|uniref:ATP-dependent clp protease proteolytic subunit n=1 Tax=Grosmannia clavigera (strain kw1407 / UAMH 11150) TaxID=655863 RepID=F0XNZ8_GROCL|nr:ATP-dependent clp protease proteolytic subunit [Grosmannia clavigera kw1407]EFX00264.1 ATP-dependent clp protease proteolytic subunit [Grosmannia clavigera kw1407]